MKPKQLKSKLNVKKQTISNLNGDQLDDVRGGAIAPTLVSRCVTYCFEHTCRNCQTDCTSVIMCSC